MLCNARCSTTRLSISVALYELGEQSWIVGAAEPDDVFSDEPGELWSRVLRRQGGGLALLATMPLDPSSN